MAGDDARVLCCVCVCVVVCICVSTDAIGAVWDLCIAQLEDGRQPVDECDAVHTDERQDCGFPGISDTACTACDASGPDRARCQKDGCCYREEPGPYCYFSYPIRRPVTVEAAPIFEGGAVWNSVTLNCPSDELPITIQQATYGLPVSLPCATVPVGNWNQAAGATCDGKAKCIVSSCPCGDGATCPQGVPCAENWVDPANGCAKGITVTYLCGASEAEAALLPVGIGCGLLLCFTMMICSSGCPCMNFSASSLPGPCASVVYTANTAVRRLGDCLQRASCGTCAVTPAARVAHHLMTTTWKKTSTYEFVRVKRVETLRNERLARRYHQYKWSLPDDTINIPTVGSVNAPNVGNRVINSQRLKKHSGRTTVGSLEEALTREQRQRWCGHFFRCGSDVVGNELFVFHASAHKNYVSLAADGFLKRYWRTATGSWQRFGAGFYFAPDASKSHEYPLGEMQRLSPGLHTRTMLLCKVARGRIYMTQTDTPNMRGDRLQSLGYNSLHGYAGTRLNYDEFVVYEEEAILPYALVTYEFRKK
eukprot:COSAG02_NODE_2309_length_9170_cov_10.752508_7_plen_536_part_00